MQRVSAIEMEELRQDIIIQDFRDAQHEYRIRKDLDYLLENLNTGRTLENLKKLQKTCREYGFSLTLKELEAKLDGS